MRSSLRFVISLTILLSAQPLTTLAQDQTGTITGRVTLDGKPAQGVIVLAESIASRPGLELDQILKPPVPTKAVTDSEGRYRFEGLPVGKYNVGPFTPTMVRSDRGNDEDEVRVTDGATVEGIDFALTRGGVITGKITDSEGRPVIAEQIVLKSGDAGKPLQMPGDEDQRMFYTDDRGVYRIFGLRPGRYIVSSGAAQNMISGLLMKRPKRVQTYYPGVVEEARARLVELAAGAEVSGIDIKLVAADKGFMVSGRVTDAETGAPVNNAFIAYFKAREEGSDKNHRDPSEFSPGGMTTTNVKGEFRFDSLAPGNYRAEVQSTAQITGSGGFYADPFNFEVQSANVEKLEIKVHSGASISGIVVAEKSDDADALNLGEIMLFAQVTGAAGQGAPSSGLIRIAADGSFRVSGLKAGKAKIGPIPYGEQKFSVVRVERDGMDVSAGIDIQGNEQVSGVRIIVAPANCIIRGRVIIQGDAASLPSDISVNIRPQSGFDGPRRDIPVDPKGNFTIEYLQPGEYLVSASVSLPGGRVTSREQNVTAIQGVPADVTLMLKTTPDK